MSQFAINMLFVGASFVLYIGIALWARAGSTKEFYVAGDLLFGGASEEQGRV